MIPPEGGGIKDFFVLVTIGGGGAAGATVVASFLVFFFLLTGIGGGITLDFLAFFLGCDSSSIATLELCSSVSQWSFY